MKLETAEEVIEAIRKEKKAFALTLSSGER